MKMVLTGAGGFLGWHTRLLAFSRGLQQIESIKLGDEFDLQSAKMAVDGTERLIHIAGINRGSQDEVEHGNVRLAQQLAQTLESVKNPPRVVVYANSVQADLDNPYGRGKRLAGETLSTACNNLGINFVELKLPNLFGEEGRPFYNSVVATFAHQVVQGQILRVDEDRVLPLMHAQEASRLLLDAFATTELHGAEVRKISVSDIADTFIEFHAKYSLGEIPNIVNPFNRDLFNTYRAASFEQQPRIALDPKHDNRGFLVETLKSHGGEGQTFFSTTKPGITRGDHYHLRKVERFIVLSGDATIRLRKMFHDDVREFRVNGNEPTAVDMPIGWVHNITNTGKSELLTQFWTNEIFDPSDTDTFYERV